MTKELLKNIEVELQAIVSDSTSQTTGERISSYREQRIKNFIFQIATAERKAGREEIIKLIDESYKGHGLKMPNHPHNDDINFFNYTPCGIYNKALADIKSKLNK
jgi:hypothetical protein